MAYSFKGGIQFGMVYFPVVLYTAAKRSEIGFNLIDRQSMSRIKYKKISSTGDEVKAEDIVKGYEYEDGKYVLFDDDDFEKIKSARDRNITIELFVSEGEVDPVYFDKAYYALPAGGEKAFSLFASALEAEKKAAVGRAVMGTKETLVYLRAVDGALIASTLFFRDEVNVEKPATLPKPSEKELDLAGRVISEMTGKYRPENYSNEYYTKLKNAIERKIEGKEIVREKGSEGTVADLMEALKLSLEKFSNGKAAAATNKTAAKRKGSGNGHVQRA